MNTLWLDHLALFFSPRQLSRCAVPLAFVVALATHMCLAQDSNSPRIPDGEAQFTPTQLEQYYKVYKNADVRYLRTVFDAYLKSECSEQERQTLDKWNKEYFHSKFIVMSRDQNTFGGSFITILFQDRPDKVFVAWVYPEGAAKKLTLRNFDLGNFSAEDVKRINTRYKKLIADTAHAM